MPSFVASKMTILADNSAEKPVEGSISASLVPTVFITSFPKNQSPTIKDTPKVNIATNGIGAEDPMTPVFKTSKIAAKGPIALAISFAP